MVRLAQGQERPLVFTGWQDTGTDQSERTQAVGCQCGCRLCAGGGCHGGCRRGPVEQSGSFWSFRGAGLASCPQHEARGIGPWSGALCSA